MTTTTPTIPTARTGRFAAVANHRGLVQVSLAMAFLSLITLPLSLTAMRRSRKVDERVAAGDLYGAEAASRTAFGFAVAAIVTAVVLNVVVFIVLSAVDPASSSTTYR